MKRYLAGTCALIGLLVVAGCGSDGDNSPNASDASATISKSDYLKRADAICARTEKKQRRLVRSFDKRKPTRQAQIELIEHAGVPPLKEQAKEISELPVPREDAGQAKAYVAAFSDAVKKYDEDPGAALDGLLPFTEAEALAVKLGFKVCGGP